MSKSSGKIMTIDELEEKGFVPLSYRYFTFTAHYRKPLTWSLEGLGNAQDAYKRAKKIISSLKDDKEKANKKYLDEFEKVINNDLDMPGALAVLWKLLRDKGATGKVATIKKLDEVLGLDLLKKEKQKDISNVKDLIEKRKKARKEKDWKSSDKLRAEIINKGHTVKDTQDGFMVSGAVFLTTGKNG
tara:strand:- start:362 stop:922 length:561 start_codon:yes stop_codon:yes gene_type:complete